MTLHAPSAKFWEAFSGVKIWCKVQKDWYRGQNSSSKWPLVLLKVLVSALRYLLLTDSEHRCNLSVSDINVKVITVNRRWYRWKGRDKNGASKCSLGTSECETDKNFFCSWNQGHDCLVGLNNVLSNLFETGLAHWVSIPEGSTFYSIKIYIFLNLVWVCDKLWGWSKPG